jgi:hypothetical protein
MARIIVGGKSKVQKWRKALELLCKQLFKKHFENYWPLENVFMFRDVDEQMREFMQKSMSLMWISKSLCLSLLRVSPSA